MKNTRTDSNRLPWWVLLIVICIFVPFFIVSLAFILTGLQSQAQTEQDFNQNLATTTGTVSSVISETKLVEDDFTDSPSYGQSYYQTNYTAHVTFAVDNKTYSLDGAVGATTKANDPIAVYYNSHNPQQSSLKPPTNSDGYKITHLLITLAGLGLALVLLFAFGLSLRAIGYLPDFLYPVILFFLFLRRLNPDPKKRFSKQLEASYVGMEEAKLKNNQWGYRLVCRWYSSKDEQSYIFKSAPLTFNPAEFYKQGDIVIVWYNEDNYKKYYVEVAQRFSEKAESIK